MSDARPVSRCSRLEIALSRLDLSRLDLPRLDARMPLVLDTHELDRRPGTMRKVSVREPAPADLGNEVIGVQPGSQLDLDLRLESVLEGILVTGVVRAMAVGECARCLEPLERQLEVDIQELFAYPGHEPDDEADEPAVVQNDLIDLEPTVRDAVVIDLPLAPVCREDCPGLCPQCGALLAADQNHQHDSIDLRWAALDGLGESVGAAHTSGTSAVSVIDARLDAGGREES